MKVGIFVLTMALVCIGVSLAAPATAPVDWKQVEAKLSEIQQEIAKIAFDIINIVTKNNPQVGAVFAEKIGEAGVKANVIFQQISESIYYQSLVKDEATVKITELIHVYLDVQDELLPELEKLSEDAYNKTVDVLVDGTTLIVYPLAEEFLNLLE